MAPEGSRWEVDSPPVCQTRLEMAGSPKLEDQIVELLKKDGGLSDREITDRLKGTGAEQQPVNQACRRLAARGVLVRHKRSDHRLGNYLIEGDPSHKPPHAAGSSQAPNRRLSEDEIRCALQSHLRPQGWETAVSWGRAQGIDVEARRGEQRWVIEVKGIGSLPQMRVNFFLAVLGELLQRMDNESAKYSIALPDVEQFQKLWEKLPAIAKLRTRITVLFVDDEGNVRELP